jgi:hypothetical protein
VKLLVPLPFDVSELEHGRNLRVVHLIRRLKQHGAVTCVAPGLSLADRAEQVLPDVNVASAQGSPPLLIDDLPLERSSTVLGRWLCLFGPDP